jgi:hypothetical protein
MRVGLSATIGSAACGGADSAGIAGGLPIDAWTGMEIV